MTPQVTLFSRAPAPDPAKIAIFLQELKVNYDLIHKEMGDVCNGMKRPDFLEINPNGRVPAIIDHTNNNHIVWESGAILLYLAERFDPTGKYAGKTLEERSEVWQWLIFQVSGLGPMQGQANWFINYNTVQDLHPSVLERYQNETRRVWGVIEKRLAEEGEWIALKRFTIADIAYYPWFKIRHYASLDFGDFPHLDAYCKRLEVLPAIEEAYAKLVPPK